MEQKTVAARPPHPTRGPRVLFGIARLAPSREIREPPQKRPAESKPAVRLIQSLTQIKRGSGIWLDLARMKCCARIARRLRRKKRSCVKAAARPGTSVSGKWDACRSASGFGIFL